MMQSSPRYDTWADLFCLCTKSLFGPYADLRREISVRYTAMTQSSPRYVKSLQVSLPLYTKSLFDTYADLSASRTRPGRRSLPWRGNSKSINAARRRKWPRLLHGLMMCAASYLRMSEWNRLECVLLLLECVLQLPEDERVKRVRMCSLATRMCSPATWGWASETG